MSNQQAAMAVYQNPNDLKKFLESASSVIAAALPRHLTKERMIRLALTSFSTTKKLRECTAHSILSSIVLASQLGLEIGLGGQGYLIPYNGTCTFVPGWRGLLSLVNNSGRATAWTGAVFEGDDFDFQLGSHPRCNHIPGPNYGDDTKLEKVYAIGKVNGAEMAIMEMWPMARVFRHRDKSNKVGREHYSFKHPEMYGRKVVLLQVLKYLPLSIELQNAVVAADAGETGRMVQVQDPGPNGFVIDIGDADEISTGTVGSNAPSLTEARVAQRPPKEEPAPAASKGPPTVAELIKSIITKGTALNAGKGKITKTLIAMGRLAADHTLESLDANQLATILETWDEVSAQIQNPTEPS